MPRRNGFWKGAAFGAGCTLIGGLMGIALPGAGRYDVPPPPSAVIADPGVVPGPAPEEEPSVSADVPQTPGVESIEASEAQTAYWLMAPKLMLSVQALRDGPVIVHFANRTEHLAVGQHVEFTHEGCACFLLLRKSTREGAVFDFRCREVRKARTRR